MLPEGVDGYQCYRRENTSAGPVSAEVYPDYHGGYQAFSMTWETGHVNLDLPEAHAVWTRGPKAIAPPGWLTVSQDLDLLPPLHTKIRLQLSSGEFQEQEFVAAKDWKSRKAMEGRFRFGGSVNVTDAAFIEKFTQAAWAEITIVDPTGVTHAQNRLDLAGVPEALVVMRRLGDQVLDDVSDYQHRCAVIHIEVN